MNEFEFQRRWDALQDAYDNQDPPEWDDDEEEEDDDDCEEPPEPDDYQVERYLWNRFGGW